nr:MAG TPA: hypothetical protein [Caudoviricetes sp.]
MNTLFFEIFFYSFRSTLSLHNKRALHGLLFKLSMSMRLKSVSVVV